MTKLNVNIHEAKTHLSKYLRRVQEGQQVTLCKKGSPIAEIIPFRPQKKGSSWQYLGIAKHLIGRVAKDFDKPLSEKELPGFGL
ncbi:MAG: type II toxin-antitoxin system Phd/YefM family antitoxin [Deltaproteobacteria bacterium]|nr:type II toxin-antitoxin system Phd/YefM family antitoxin [Deltaproteobacteria bacterium]